MPINNNLQPKISTSTKNRSLLPMRMLPESMDTLHHAVHNHQILLDPLMTLGGSGHHQLDALFASSTQFLSDAAAAEQKSGPWQAYLQLFKNALSFVHSTIDGPLEKVGITQTWGISIALFTASKFMCEENAIISPCVVLTSSLIHHLLSGSICLDSSFH